MAGFKREPLDDLRRLEHHGVVRSEVEDAALPMQQVVGLAALVAGPPTACALEDEAEAEAHAVEESCARFGAAPLDEVPIGLFFVLWLIWHADGSLVLEQVEASVSTALCTQRDLLWDAE